ELIGIEEGTADVIRDGKKIASLKEGDLIGEMGLLEREPRNADVIATSPMVVMKLTHWEIRRMSEETLGRIQEIVAKRRADGVPARAYCAFAGGAAFLGPPARGHVGLLQLPTPRSRARTARERRGAGPRPTVVDRWVVSGGCPY